jgi:phosphatidylglycerophosphate synthase
MNRKLAVLLVNSISVSRGLSGIYVFYLLSVRRFLLALIIFIGFALTDKFDGYLARVLDSKTRVGAEIDASMDTLLIALTILGCSIIFGWSSYILIAILMAIVLLWVSQFIFPKHQKRLSAILTVAGIGGYIITGFMLAWLAVASV